MASRGRPALDGRSAQRQLEAVDDRLGGAEAGVRRLAVVAQDRYRRRR